GQKLDLHLRGEVGVVRLIREGRKGRNTQQQCCRCDQTVVKDFPHPFLHCPERRETPLRLRSVVSRAARRQSGGRPRIALEAAATIVSTRNATNRIHAMFAAAPAIPVNPTTPAITARMKKVSAH